MNNNSALSVQILTTRLEAAKDRLNNEIKVFSDGSAVEETLDSLGEVFGSRAFFNALVAALELDSGDEDNHAATLAVVGVTGAIAALKTALAFWKRKRVYNRLIESLHLIESAEILIVTDELVPANELLLELEGNRVEQKIIPKRPLF
jgi:hypothetical protein